MRFRFRGNQDTKFPWVLEVQRSRLRGNYNDVSWVQGCGETGERQQGKWSRIILLLGNRSGWWNERGYFVQHEQKGEMTRTAEEERRSDPSNTRTSLRCRGTICGVGKKRGTMPRGWKRLLGHRIGTWASSGEGHRSPRRCIIWEFDVCLKLRTRGDAARGYP